MIVTSFSRAGYDEYGLTNIKTFLEFWPSQSLTVYHEGLPADAIQDPRVVYIDMTQFDSFLAFARALYEADPLYKGIMAGKGAEQAYNYRFNAFKFFRKVWAMKHYDETREDDSLFAWLDADIVFKKAVPEQFLRSLVKPGDYMAYIGRGGGIHSETGAIVFDPSSEHHSSFIDLMWRIFETGAFRLLAEWSDSYIFDFVRDLTQVPATNLGAGCDPVHPFVFTKLGLYMDHLKGPTRKAAGESPEAKGVSKAEVDRMVSVSNGGERQARPTVEQMKANHVERYRWAAKQVADIWPRKSATVLDASCGVGYGSQILAEVSGSVRGVDISREAIEYAEDYYGGDTIFFSLMDLADEETGLGKYDASVSLETIEHVEDSARLIKRFHGSSRYLVGSVPNEDVVPFRKKEHPYHYRHFTKDQLEQMLNGAGYRVTKWATQYDKIPGVVHDDKTDGMCLLFVAEAIW